MRPYICTFEDCRHELAQFSTREAWAAHEFSEHRSCRWWACPECSVECSSSFSWVDHVARTHPAFTKATTSSASGLLMAKTAAYRQGERPIEDEKCPLCDAIPGFSRRTFVDHVCRHMEELSLAVLPRREVADIPDKASADEVFEPELSRIESDAEDSVASEVSQEDQDTGMGSLSNQWSEQQQQEFPQLIHCFGTNFAAIAQTRIMSDKTAAKVRVLIVRSIRAKSLLAFCRYENTTIIVSRKRRLGKPLSNWPTSPIRPADRSLYELTTYKGAYKRKEKMERNTCSISVRNNGSRQ